MDNKAKKCTLWNLYGSRKKHLKSLAENLLQGISKYEGWGFRQQCKMNCVDSVMSYNTQTWEINKEIFSRSSEVQTPQNVQYLYLTSENGHVWEYPKFFLCKYVTLPWSSKDRVSPKKWKKIFINSLVWTLRHLCCFPRHIFLEICYGPT